jgi:hypothetical protein
MSAVKSNNISREQASHESGQWLFPGTEKKVRMIAQKSPRITVCLRAGTENLNPFNKVLTVFIVPEYFPAFYPTNHYVVQNARSI